MAKLRVNEGKAMENKRCSICGKGNLSEDAPILAISGYGIPRCLCDDCAERIHIITYGKDTEDVSSASLALTADVAEHSIDDDLVYNTVTELLEYASDRAKKINEGTWDFALDEAEEEPEELPEELLESEEDKLLDQKEKEQSKRVDKVMNWVYLGVVLATVAFMVYFLFFK